jgi:ABC-type transport system substrate-binding protein
MMIDENDDHEPDAGAITKVDIDTVKFALKDTFSSPLVLKSLSTVFICPKHIWEPKIDELEAADSSIDQYALEEASDTTIAELLIGSGPFLFKKYRERQYVLYEKDLNYWKGTPATVDEVMLKMYATTESATSALKAGDVDMLATLEDAKDVPKLLLNQNIKINIMTNFNSNMMFYLNMRYPPFNIYEVRQAIDMVIERQDIIDYVAFGYGTLPQMAPLAPGLVDSSDKVAWIDRYVDDGGNQLLLATRIENANALLDAVEGMSARPEDPPADWVRTHNGNEMSIEIMYRGSPTYKQIADLIADDLAAIGIEITLKHDHSLCSGWVTGTNPWKYESIIFGYPNDPDFEEFATEWIIETCLTQADGGWVGWLNYPEEAPPGTEGGKPQTYGTPYENPTPEQQAQWLAIYNQLVAESTVLSDALDATRHIVDPEDHLAAALATQEQFADALPIINLYHPNHVSAYSRADFTGWDELRGVYYYGFAPPTISVRTLMALIPVDN